MSHDQPSHLPPVPPAITLRVMPGLDRILRQLATHADETMWEDLVIHQRPVVIAVCRHVLRHASPVDDAVQETFLRVHRDIGLFRGSTETPDRTAQAWILQIARATAYRWSRSQSQSRLVALTDAAVAAPASPSPTEVSSIDRESALPRTELVRQAVGALTDDQRWVIEQRFNSARSYTDIASELGISDVAVRKRVQSTLALLRRRLGNVALPLLVIALVTPSAWAGTAVVAGATVAGSAGVSWWTTLTGKVAMVATAALLAGSLILAREVMQQPTQPPAVLPSATATPASTPQSVAPPAATTPAPPVAALRLHFSAAEGVVSDADSRVSVWTDRVAGHRAIASGDQRPELSVDAFRGQPALRFDGVASALDLVDGAFLNDCHQGTIAAWVLLERQQPDDRTGVLADVFFAADTPTGEHGFRFDVSLGKFNAWTNYGPDYTDQSIYRAPLPPTDRWYHLAYVAADNGGRLLIDGVQQPAEYLVSPNLDPPHPVPFFAARATPDVRYRIGASIAAEFQYLRGWIADLRIWDGPLSNAEIDALAHAMP